ncbi:MAG TPA: sodium:solute symporter family protein [Candidatus Krumholzibacteriaceae bacterium]|nr:sodium:solute symporter family protein [Candidatus Krumholzibacteriaceae bacterium]
MFGALSAADLIFIALYLALIFGIGIFLSRRASKSTEEFFVSGRSLPWWIIGTSMVATTLAADTPLVVSGLVARGGIYENWMWWQWGIGGMATVFLFAKLWKRAGITTDAELIELRYDGKVAAGLRGYRAFWFGLLQNVLVIAWVMKAMAKIVVTVMGWDDGVLLFGVNAEVIVVLILFLIAVSYTVLSGLWGVVMTDFLQFVIAMGGSVYLAAVSYIRVGGLEGIKNGLVRGDFDPGRVLQIIPEASGLTEAGPFTEFLILILVVWWASYTIDGGGYLAQRLFAAKDERHSVLGYLWFSIAHICLRPWPWIVVGLCGMAFFGAVDDPETYYPMMMKAMLPPGVFGILIASFFAAFMSTVDTQLNWGSSLLVNDFLKRFVWRGRSEKEYVAAARLIIVALAVLGALVSFTIDDISFAWKFIISVTAGIGSVYIARWYWWRVNAWSEIAAMATAFLTTVVFRLLSGTPQLAGKAFLEFPYSTALTVAVTLPVWISVTLFTRPVSEGHLERFWKKVRPGGPGWKRIRERFPEIESKGNAKRTAARIVLGIVALNSALVGTGNLLLGKTRFGIILIFSTAAASILLFFSIKKKS